MAVFDATVAVGDDGVFIWNGAGPYNTSGNITTTTRRFVNRFTLPIPRTAVIVSATWTLSAGASTSTEARAVALAVNQDDTAGGAFATEFFTSLTPVTSETGFLVGPSRAYDVTTQVAAVIGRAGWVAGNSLTLIARPTGSSPSIIFVTSSGDTPGTLSVTYTNDFVNEVNSSVDITDGILVQSDTYITGTDSVNITDSFTQFSEHLVGAPVVNDNLGVSDSVTTIFTNPSLRTSTSEVGITDAVDAILERFVPPPLPQQRPLLPAPRAYRSARGIPPGEVVDAYLSGTTHHTQRVEIYESNGSTRWRPDLEIGIESGSVSIDQTRDERRTLDIVFDNSEGYLVNAPGEFWYDKILKVYRGVNLKRKPRPPRIAVLGPLDYEFSNQFRFAMSSVGYGEVRFLGYEASLAQLREFDIVGAVNIDNTAYVTKLNTLYNEGIPIFSIGAVTPAIYGSILPETATESSNLIQSLTPGVNPQPIAHPVAVGWSSWTHEYLGTDSYTLSGVKYTAVPNFATISAGPLETVFVSVRAEIEPDKRWVLIHFPIRDGLLEQQQLRNLLGSMIRWLNPVIESDHWEMQIGEFMIDRISEPHFPPIVKVTGRDYAKKGLLSKYLFATQYSTGLSLESLIGTIAGAANINKRLLPATGKTINRAFFFDRDVNRWEAMKEIANAYDHEIFFDAQGYLVLQPYNDPLETTPAFTFSTDPDTGSLLSYEKSTSDTQLYNTILVYGESSDANIPPVYAVAQNTNPLSRTSVSAIGERVYSYSSSFIQTQAQAQALANTYLSIYALEEYELNLGTLILPWLEVGEILKFVDPRPAPDDPSSFLLSSVTIPLDAGEMSSVGKRIIRVTS